MDQDRKDTIDLTNLNKKSKDKKSQTSASSLKIKHPFKKHKGPLRDDEGKFTATTGSGGLKAAKAFNWKRAAPIIVVVALVGGVMVYQSFAGSAVIMRLQTMMMKSNSGAPGTALCKRAGIRLEDAGSKENVNEAWVRQAYQKIYAAEPETSEILEWMARADAISAEYKKKGDKTGMLCKVAPDVYREIEAAKAAGRKPLRSTQPIIEDKDIPTTDAAIVKTIYGKDMRRSQPHDTYLLKKGDWTRLEYILPEQSLGTMGGSLGDGKETEEDYEIRRDHGYEQKNPIEDTRIAGNHVYRIPYQDYAATDGVPRPQSRVYPYEWETHWGEKIKICALIYEGGDTFSPRDKSSRAPNQEYGRFYDDKLKIMITSRGSSNYYLQQQPTKVYKVADLKDYNAGKHGLFRNNSPNGFVPAWAKFYICSNPIEKREASYTGQSKKAVAPEVLPNRDRPLQNWKTKPGDPFFAIERFDIVRVP